MEKLAQLDPNTGLGPLGNSKAKPFDAAILLKSFQSSMAVLKELAEKNERRVEKLEQVCSKQQREHAVKLQELEGIYAVRGGAYSTTQYSTRMHVHTHTHTHTHT